MKIKLDLHTISTDVDFLRVDLNKTDLLMKRLYTKRQSDEVEDAPPPNTSPMDPPPPLTGAAPIDPAPPLAGAVPPVHLGAASGSHASAPRAIPPTPPSAFAWHRAFAAVGAPAMRETSDDMDNHL